MAGYLRLLDCESTLLGLLIEWPIEMYGLQLTELSKLDPAVVYRALKRMETNGFIKSREEEPKEKRPGRPPRLYKYTALGKRLYKLKLDTDKFLRRS